METKSITNYWSHMRFSLAMDPTKYVHLLLPVGECDPEEHVSPKWYALIPKSHDVFLSDLLIAYPEKTAGFSQALLRSCNLIVEDLENTGQLIKMIRGYCDRFNNSREAVLLSTDDELREWLTGTAWRSVQWNVPDIRKPIWERHLLIIEMVTVYDHEKPDQA